jgi:ribonuclease D
MSAFHPTPDKEQIALLEPFDRLGLPRISVISTAQQADQALAVLALAPALGFDTESKPTFAKDEVSTGPHIVQFSTMDHAWVIQLHDPQCSGMVANFLAQHAGSKLGFGLGDDIRRITHKLGVQARNVIDLNDVFRHQGYRKDMGVKAAVAVLFNKRFLKSKKAATSNWANPHLTESQVTYAANDAYAAMRVYAAMPASWVSAAPQPRS